MPISRDALYLVKLQKIIKFIAEDSLHQALRFQIDLDEKIEDLENMPYKFRKSFYFDDENIRDLIFKGYVIPYKIDKIKNTITIIGINKYQSNL